jgi:transposase
MKKRAYRSVPVKNIDIQEVLKHLPPGPVWVGLDIAKLDFQAVLRNAVGQVQRPWKVRQPSEVKEFVERMVQVSQKHPVTIAMESTGTYGDVLRQSLGDAGLPVHRVSAKAAHDYAEVYDGVASQHDGKDAAVVAELSALGKSCAWPARAAGDEELHATVRWMDAQQQVLQGWLGRLEALLARHWPEATRILDLNSATLLCVLIEYGGPQALREDPESGPKLARWGGARLMPKKIEALQKSAGTTLGVRMTEAHCQLMRRYGRQAQQARIELRQAQALLRRRAHENPILERMAQAVGGPTACVLWVTVGDPRKFPCGAAYRKAMGLNLKERSSGQYQGQLKISKRGPSLARRWLYFAALRILQRPPVQEWFARKKKKDQDRGGKGAVAVMRRLAVALHAVATGEQPFDRQKLFSRGSGSRKKSPSGKSSLGALPPDPRDLPLSCQDRREVKKAAETSGLTPPDRSISAPGSALESVPTGALSSAQFEKA